MNELLRSVVLSCPVEVVLVALISTLQSQLAQYEAGHVPPLDGSDGDLYRLYAYLRAAVCPRSRGKDAYDPCVLRSLLEAADPALHAALAIEHRLLDAQGLVACPDWRAVLGDPMTPSEEANGHNGTGRGGGGPSSPQAGSAPRSAILI